jgi:hypothetical protein
MVTWEDATSVDRSREVGRWSIRLGTLASPSRAEVPLLQVTVPPNPNDTAETALVARGYSLLVSAQNDLLFANIAVQLALWPRPIIGLAPMPQPITPSGSIPPSAPLPPGSSTQFNVALALPDADWFEVLHEQEPGHLTARIRLPDLARPETGRLSFSLVWLTISHDASLVLGSWDVTLAPTRVASRHDFLFLDRSVRSGPDNDLSAASASSFHITASQQIDASGPLLWIDIHLELK